MTAPRGLGNRGRALWRSISKALPDGWELDEREVAVLTLAARQSDDVAKLETAIKREGTMVRGSAAQPVVNPAITEARQGRLAIGRLLGQLSLPDEEGKPLSGASEHAQHAARSRWGRIADRRKRSRGTS